MESTHVVSVSPFHCALTGIDITLLVAYLLGIVGLGCWAGLRKLSKKGEEAKDYFLAGRHLNWFMIGLSLFATNISCLHLVALAQAGFDTGLLMGNFEWMAALTLILLSLFFAPFYFRSGVTTLPDFLEKRFNRACRDWLAVVSIIASVSINVTFSFLTGGMVLETLFGVDMYQCILVISVLVGLYTVIGGLSAVVWTEMIQTFVLLGGACAITIACWNSLAHSTGEASTGLFAGWDVLKQVVAREGEPERLSMLQSTGSLPWFAIFLGYPVIGIWYWCADQTIVQRVLGAKDENHARVGPLFAGLIKILPVFLFILPGLFAWALWKNGALDLKAITTVVDGKETVNSKGIYTIMITQLLSPGLVGAIVAAMLAGLMSNVAASLNSISTLVSYNLYRRLKPDSSEVQVVLVGRIAVVGAIVVGIGAVYLAKNYDSIFAGINDIIAHIAPPITTVFLIGVFWRRASALAAQYTLWIGSTLGVVVFVVAKCAPLWGVEHIEPFAFLVTTSFMMKAFWLFCVCCVIMVTLSLAKPGELSAEQMKLCWASPLEPIRQPGWPGVFDYRFLSALLIVIMIVLYTVFR